MVTAPHCIAIKVERAVATLENRRGFDVGLVRPSSNDSAIPTGLPGVGWIRQKRGGNKKRQGQDSISHGGSQSNSPLIISGVVPLAR